MTQHELLRLAVNVLEEMDVTYMIVGSYASSSLGEPRFTQDIDIVVKLVPEDLVALGKAFTEPDFYYECSMAAQALSTGGMFNIIHPSSGNKIDFIIARSDMWGRSQIARRQRVFILPDHQAYVASPEDIILNKMLFYREGASEVHLRDIAGVLKISSDKVDCEYVTDWANQLGVADIWLDIQQRLQD